MRVNESYSPLILKENKKLSIPLVFYVPFAVIYFVYGQRPNEIPLIGQYLPTPVITSTMTQAYTFPQTVTQGISIPSFTPAYVLPASYYPTATKTYEEWISYSEYFYPFEFPIVKNMGDYYLSPHTVLFSYYYPDLGGVNCHIDNWVDGHCKNITASGVGWRDYLGHGLAVHPDMLDLLPYGSTLYVSNPPQLAGVWVVVDLCGGCQINNKYYFDFLLPEMPDRMNWSDPVEFGVYRIGWDGDFPSPTPFVFSSVTPTPTSTVVHYPTVTMTPAYTVTSLPSETFTSVPTALPSETSTLVPTALPSETSMPTP